MKMKNFVFFLLIICLNFIAILADDAVVTPQKTDNKNEKFSIPVWHPDARWQVEKFGGCGLVGNLDGPRKEMEFFSVGILNICYQSNGAGKYVYGSYDDTTERAHLVIGSARGYLDGPFSRARFGGWDYVVRSTSTSSLDGRYYYFTDGYNGHALRLLDFEKQEVTTLLPDAKKVLGIVSGSKGRLYVMHSTGQIEIINDDGKSENGVKLQYEAKMSGWGFSLAIDEKKNRLYATAYATKDYYIWYWDLKDGSYHGVLPTPEKSGKDRGRNVPGPFEGTNLYGQGTIMFGPDDPDCRYLYTGRTDTWNLFRLDLEKKEIYGLKVESGGGKDKAPQIVSFSNKETTKVPFYTGGIWRNDGSFVSLVHTPFDSWIFRRIK